MTVTGPGGFRAAGVAAGIKPSGALDLALVVNDGPLDVAAGVFTRNVSKAAPVLWTQEVLKQQRLKAVVLNSGGANAATGPGGFQDTHATAEKVAEVLGSGAIEVAVCSTGPSGERLPMAAVLSGVDSAVKALDASPEAGLDAAAAVMSTDSKPQQGFAKHDSGWSVGGFAEGAGVLSILTTDAVVDKETLDRALRAATKVTLDGANDTVLVLASGASGIEPTEAALTELLSAVSLRYVEENSAYSS